VEIIKIYERYPPLTTRVSMQLAFLKQMLAEPYTPGPDFIAKFKKARDQKYKNRELLKCREPS
jgi:hypothetical protein